MKFRKDDIVSVQGAVEYDHDGGGDGMFIKIPGGGGSLFLTPDYWDRAGLKLVQPKFEVDDWVLWDGGFATGECGQIVGISGDHAWIDMGSGHYATRHFGAIERGSEHPQEVSDAS